MYVRSRDISIGTATSYGLDGRGSMSGRGKRFYFLHTVQTVTTLHPASYPVGTEVSFPGDKVAEA
jgi:hypothetical protein